jgi:cell division protein FtsB
MDKPAINTMSREHILWANNMLEAQNEVLMQSCQDFREKNDKLKAEIEQLKSVNAVLKMTIQNINRRA